MRLPTLRIGDLTIPTPIIQGGMGVRVSGARLASAVANEGCAGMIASAGIAHYELYSGKHFVEMNDLALKEEIQKARSLSSGVIGVNIMVALSNYANLVKVAVENKVSMIVSGAGLPLELPGLVQDAQVKLVPIVSSARALRIICTKWLRAHNRLPDAVVVEGPQAGGHLGFSHAEMGAETQPSLEKLVAETVAVANSYERPMPVIAAGGIYDGADISRFLKLGASGVQMATRFVCTEECDVDDAFKNAYLQAKEEDVMVIHSPVGMPARVIRNAFVERILRGETVPFKCEYRCLRSCDPKTAPFCIAKALANAAAGKLEDAFAFAGSKVRRCAEIVSVKKLVSQLVAEASACYDA
ncbi:nitronate monooxygenase family protein [bacterium]|nr:nitronate monooxygenase family protein [bacterium]